MKRRLASERGEELIAFAFASSIFFLLLFGIIGGGLTIYRYNMLSTLAQDGARWGSVRGNTADSTMRASLSDVQSYVSGRAQAMTVAVTPSAAPSGLSPGSSLTVLVTTQYAPFPYVPWAAFQLRATAATTMVR